MMSRRNRVAVLMLAAAGAAAGGWWTYRTRTAAGAEDLPTAPARLGDFMVLIRCRGEVKARRSVQVTAPQNVPDLRIIWLAPAGNTVKEGEPVIRFDPSTAKQQLAEKEADLRKAQASLDQMLAQSRLTMEQERIELSYAGYSVERAELEVSKQEIVSRIKGDASKIDLGVAQKKLDVQRAKVDLTEVSSRAKIASLTRVRDKAKEDVDITKERLSKMELKSPITGMITYLRNNSQGWMNSKPFKVGDAVWPGAAIAEIPDLASLEMEAKIEEIDRGKVQAGQEARVRVDSLPESSFPAKLVSISPMVAAGWEWPPTRNFLGYAKLDSIDPRLRPGMNGRLDAFVEKLANVISVPAKAVFVRGGRPIVYVKAKSASWTPMPVEILARNPDETAVKGIEAGTKVALMEPASAGGGAGGGPAASGAAK